MDCAQSSIYCEQLFFPNQSLVSVLVLLSSYINSNNRLSSCIFVSLGFMYQYLPLIINNNMLLVGYNIEQQTGHVKD